MSWKIVGDADVEMPKNKSSNQSSVDGFISEGNKNRLSAFLGGGIAPMVGGAKDTEDLLPVINATLGGIAGSFLGKPNLGVGIGTAVGEAEKQTIDSLMDKSKRVSVEDILIKGGAAAAGSKVLGTLIKSVGVAKNIVPERARSEFFNKALQAVNVGKKKLSSNFAKSISDLAQKYPNSRVDLREPLKQVKDMLSGTGEDNLVPQLMTAVKRSPRLMEVVKDPTKALNLTLQESLDLKNAITSTTNSITRKAVQGKSTPNERVVFEILDTIDSKITDPFPEMANIRQVYSAGRKAFDLARPLLEPGKAVENSIFSKPEGLFGLGGSQFMGSTQGKLAFEDIAKMTKPGGKMFEAAELAHNLNRGADAISRLSQIAIGGALLKKFGITGNSND